MPYAKSSHSDSQSARLGNEFRAALHDRPHVARTCDAARNLAENVFSARLRAATARSRIVVAARFSALPLAPQTNVVPTDCRRITK